MLFCHQQPVVSECSRQYLYNSIHHLQQQTDFQRLYSIHYPALPITCSIMQWFCPSLHPVRTYNISREVCRNFKFPHHTCNWLPIFGYKGQGRTGRLNFQIGVTSLSMKSAAEMLTTCFHSVIFPTQQLYTAKLMPGFTKCIKRLHMVTAILGTSKNEIRSSSMGRA